MGGRVGESTLTANQIGRCGSTGVEAWQGAEWVQLEFVRSRCVSGVCYFTERSQGMLELCIHQTYSLNLDDITLWESKACENQVEPRILADRQPLDIFRAVSRITVEVWLTPGYGERLELGKSRVWWENHWWTTFLRCPKRLLVAGGCCLLIYPAVWPVHLEWCGRRQKGRLLFHGLLSANAATCPVLQF